MQRYKQPSFDVHPDGEWVRYEDHVEAMKRIAKEPHDPVHSHHSDAGATLAQAVGAAAESMQSRAAGADYPIPDQAMKRIAGAQRDEPICEACNGSGEGVAGTVCTRCDGQGGFPEPDDINPVEMIGAEFQKCHASEAHPRDVDTLLEALNCTLAEHGFKVVDREDADELTDEQIAVRAGIPFVGLSVTLMKALRRLSFAAQTSGGVAGRDDELMGAIKQAQEALEAAKGKGLEEVAVDPAPASSEAASPADQVEDARDPEWQDIGRLLHKAAGAIPEGWEIQVRVERGWGGVALHDPEGDATDLDDGESSLSEQIERAIDAAMSKGDANG